MKVKTCGFCETPCNNDWCPIKEKSTDLEKTFSEKKECLECESSVRRLETENKYLKDTLREITEKLSRR